MVEKQQQNELLVPSTHRKEELQDLKSQASSFEDLSSLVESSSHDGSNKDSNENLKPDVAPKEETNEDVEVDETVSSPAENARNLETAPVFVSKSDNDLHPFVLM